MPPKDHSEYTVLVVDDEEVLRSAMEYDFRRKGFKVLSAENGVSAFEMVKANKVDVVVSDMRMPGGDGISLLASIRSVHPKVPPVIFVTGYVDISESECISRGARRVISKPYERATLMGAVLEALGLPCAG